MTGRRLWVELHRPREFHLPPLHTLVHKGEHFCHMTYSLLVFIEGHAWYAKAAGGVFLFSITAIFIRDKGE